MERKQPIQPGWLSVLVPLIGTAASIANPVLAPFAAQITIGSTLAGLGLDVAAQKLPKDALSEMLRRQIAIHRKLQEDFRNPTMRSWIELAKAQVTVAKRLQTFGVRCSRDPRLSVVEDTDGLRRHLSLSRCWDGRPRHDSIDYLRQHRPLRVNSASLNTAVEAALMVMREDFGVPMEIDQKFAHGVEQIRAMNHEATEYDFAIVADPNMFMNASAATTENYRYLIPCGWQTNRIVSKRAPRMSFDAGRLWYAAGTSGEEQVRMGSLTTLGYRNDEHRSLAINEISTKTAELERGEAIIAWEPVVSLRGLTTRTHDIVETDYRLSTSLYCHAQHAHRKDKRTALAFQDCLIAGWNTARIYSEELTARLIANPAYQENFRRIGRVM